MEELRIDALMENVDKVISVLDEKLEGVDCPIKAQMQLDVAVEEIFANICNYAYEDCGIVVISLNISEDQAELTFADEGTPFNPLKKEDFDVEEIAKSEQVGGLGIFMVKESMDEVLYEYRDKKNCLTIRKKLK